MLTCRRAVELISRRADADLPLGPRLALGLHLALCRACRTFRKQLASVHEATGNVLRDENVPDDGPDLPAEARARIHEVLQTEARP